MTWSFNASGTKEECVAMLEGGTPPTEPANARQYELMQAVLKHELEAYEAGSSGMSISASGHAPADGTAGDRSFSIWISGKAVAKAKPAARSEPPVEPKATPVAKGTEPPPTGRRT